LVPVSHRVAMYSCTVLLVALALALHSHADTASEAGGDGAPQLCFPAEQLGPHDGGWGGAPVPASLLQRCDIARVSSDISAAEFKLRFIDPQLPALITGGAADWPMHEHFKRSKITQRWPHDNFRISERAQGTEGPSTSTFAQFIDRASKQTSHDSRGLHNESTHRWMVWDDITLSEDPATLETHPARSRRDPAQLVALQRPGTQFADALVLGGPCSGSHTHSHGRSYAALAYGLKHWALVSNEMSVPEAHEECAACGDGPDVFFRRYVQPNGTQQFGGHRVLECVQQAGDIMFVPQRWHHTVMNLWASIAVVTEINDETSDEFLAMEEEWEKQNGNEDEKRDGEHENEQHSEDENEVDIFDEV